MPLLMVGVSLPLFLVEGWMRPVVGGAFIAFAAWLLVRRAQGGWQLAAIDEHRPKLEET
jgi:hypothetical protein